MRDETLIALVLIVVCITMGGAITYSEGRTAALTQDCAKSCQGGPYTFEKTGVKLHAFAGKEL